MLNRTHCFDFYASGFFTFGSLSFAAEEFLFVFVVGMSPMSSSTSSCFILGWIVGFPSSSCVVKLKSLSATTWRSYVGECTSVTHFYANFYVDFVI